MCASHEPAVTPDAATTSRESPPPPTIARRLAMLPIRLYQCTLAYFLGGHCRFEPSCSRYALEAIARHGPVRGWGLALYRLWRCQPMYPGGIDPVPPTRAEQARLDAIRQADTTGQSGSVCVPAREPHHGE